MHQLAGGVGGERARSDQHGVGLVEERAEHLDGMVVERHRVAVADADDPRLGDEECEPAGRRRDGRHLERAGPGSQRRHAGQVHGAGRLGRAAHDQELPP
jgi:hypothetical protein